ncbi:MAG: SAM-dependent chlorinase/fluorinase [Chloroflexota bacterium]|nr:SAM-dependent chlorinase/fluorinase [Chloroflexota bacterium]
MTSTERPVIGFLTDFGLDGAAATCRGVMLSICRDAQIVDISHTVQKYAIRDGAFILRASLPYLPIGIHVGVVDPGVGTSRRPVGIRVGRGDVLIGPDNGLLMPAADALGGAVEARVLANRDLWLPTTSATFHGRDVFAPVAAHLATGRTGFDAIGEPLEVPTLVRLPRATPRATHGHIETEVAYVDSFGNVRLTGGRDELTSAFAQPRAGDRFTVSIGARPPLEVAFAPSFGHVEPGTSILYIDSSGDLALADNQSDLAARIGVTSGEPVRIKTA